MTTSRADLLAGVDMEGGEGFCDSIYNFLKNQGKDINLFTNSGFGVWSQSDVNKGLGILVYDNLAGGNFAVGDTITGAVTGATGKVMTDNGATSMTLGACTGRFDDNEQIGNGVGVTADVNRPHTGRGVDLMRNTDHWVGAAGAAPPNGWTVDTAGIFTIFDSGDGAPYDKCLKIAVNAVPTANPWIYQSITTEVGKIYTFRFYFKHGDADGGNVYLGTAAGDDTYNSWIALVDAAWTEYRYTFEATTVTTFISLQTASPTDGEYELFDELSCYEITPCCTEANNIAFDGWDKADVTLDIYREHWGANARDGSFYSLKVVNVGAGEELAFPTGIHSLGEWYAQFQQRPVTMGVWVLANKASHCRILIQDSVASTYSSYHTGGGDWEWLEVTRVIDASASQVIFKFQFSVAGDVDGTTIVYISQPMAVFGWSLGEGMYQPRQQEIIWMRTFINSLRYTDFLDQSDQPSKALNIEADSDAMIPKGVKVIYIWNQVRDAGSLGANNFFLITPDITRINWEFYNSAWGLPNNVDCYRGGWMLCDDDGDVAVQIEATAANTFDVKKLRYYAVQVN